MNIQELLYKTKKIHAVMLHFVHTVIFIEAGAG